MEKHVKLKLIGKVSWKIQPYFPITAFTNPMMHMILSNKFQKFEKWGETEKIQRQEFEQPLRGHEELIDAYLEVFSKRASFYRCIISDDPRHFQYFIMKKSNSVALLFYRDVEIILI